MMKRKQRKVLVLLILAVVIITYNQRREQTGLPKQSLYPTNSTSHASFNSEEEFKRLEKMILIDEKDPEVQRAVQESKEFFEGPSSSNHATNRNLNGEKKRNAVVTSTQPSEKYYIVQENDTLSKISKKSYGTINKWRKILEANNISSPKHIKKGMKLLIPDLAERKIDTHSSPSRVKKTSSVPTNGQREYITKAGDSLFKIAKKLLNNGSRWREIYEWNKNIIPDPNRLPRGLVLVIK